MTLGCAGDAGSELVGFLISHDNTPNMITIIGTGHVFNLAEPVSFIVKNTWPDAVLIELDMSRYNALMKAQDEGAKPQGEQQMSAIYKQTARYQQRMSEEYDTQVGGEFLAAVNTGRLAGAAIIPIDTNAMQVLNDMWSEMSAMEKIRYKISGISDSIGRRASPRTRSATSRGCAGSTRPW